jgi:hypothetical protein
VRLAPGVPHALCFERAKRSRQNSRGTRGENAKMCLEKNHVMSRQEARCETTEKSCEACARNNFSSSFSLTGSLPIYSSARLPSFSMHLRKVQQILACIAPATPINSLAT